MILALRHKNTSLKWYWPCDKRPHPLHDIGFETKDHTGTSYMILALWHEATRLTLYWILTWGHNPYMILAIWHGHSPYMILALWHEAPSLTLHWNVIQVHAPYISEMSPHPLHTWYWLCDMGPHPLHDTGNVALGYTTLAILHEVTTLSCNVSLMWHWHWTQVHSPYISDMSPHPYTHDVGYVTWDHTPLRILACDMSSHPLHE